MQVQDPIEFLRQQRHSLEKALKLGDNEAKYELGKIYM